MKGRPRRQYLGRMHEMKRIGPLASVYVSRLGSVYVWPFGLPNRMKMVVSGGRRERSAQHWRNIPRKCLAQGREKNR